MTGFYIYETVDLPFQLSREDETTGILADCKNVIISFQQLDTLIEKDKSSPDVAIDDENDIINVHLSQEDTAAFKPGHVSIQINILYENMERDTSVEAIVKAYRNLHRAVMT